MNTRLIIISLLVTAIPALSGCQTIGSQPSNASAAAQIDREVDVALTKLYDSVPSAKVLAEQAKGILVFPSIVKGGFVVGAQYGRGALHKAGRTVGYYSSLAASYGLQAGIQSFGYALFFMDDAALSYPDRSEAGRSASVPASWSWTMERPSRLRRQPSKTISTRSSLANKV